MKKVKRIIVKNIEWDAPNKTELPTEITIDITQENEYLLENIDEYADNLSGYLSDIYGYCHYGFEIEKEYEDISKIYHMTASDEEVSFYVCYATSKEKAIQLTKEWIKEMGGPEEIEGVFAFRLFVIDVDRIGFNNNLISSEPIEVSYEELGIDATCEEPTSYYD